MTLETRLAAHDRATHHAGNPRLLIAADDAVVRSAPSLQLGRALAVVRTARDADEAILQAEAIRPDVVIGDAQMPAGGALQATRVIRACAPEVAIVALPCDESDSLVRAILHDGAITYVRKGIDGHELDSVLRSAIEVQAELHAESAATAPGATVIAATAGL